jgi:5-methylcytosine-specific restriction protein B
MEHSEHLAKAGPIYRAAQIWRARCLLADGSILTDKSLWTPENFAHLDRHFVQNLLHGEEDFYEKLGKQLAPAPSSAKQLAAEILWVLFLFPVSWAMAGTTKRVQIKTVWEWSGEPLPESEMMLEPVLDTGIGHPGTAYNTHRWREFEFLILAVKDLKKMPSAEREQILNDPWRLAEWLDGHEKSKGRQLYHILLHLLYPTYFEPIGTARHKRMILDHLGKDAEYKGRPVMDRAIMVVREGLEERFGEGFSFYDTEVKKLWPGKEDDAEGPGVSTQIVDAWFQERIGDAKVWAWSPGRGARLWSELRDENLLAIGWDYLGDLMDYESQAAIAEAIQANRDVPAYPTNSSLACWQFSREVRVGDFVIAKKGSSTLLGYGVVESEYEYRAEREEFRHCRRIRWERLGTWPLASDEHIAAKTLTEFTRYREWVYHAFRRMDGLDELPWIEGRDWKEDLFLTEAQLSEILDALGRKKNVILQGPPGTGKTFIGRRLAWGLNGERSDHRIRMVQFHQSYSYEDFVQGYRPSLKGGFELRRGPFYTFCQLAVEDPERSYVFVIDEINRGNLSRILGELLMLIEADKRGAEFAIPLTYSDEPFFVPENLYLIGTMNTADRSLALVDYALRRRFIFIELSPAFGSEPFVQYLAERGVDESTIQMVVSRLQAVNQSICGDRDLGRGYEIGHSYFCPQEGDEELDEAWYQRIVKHEIAPLLREYWSDDDERYQEEIQRLLA